MTPNKIYSSNQFVNTQVSLIKNWFHGYSYGVQSLGVCIQCCKGTSTLMSAGINTETHKPVLYILCLIASWLSACSLLRHSHRSTWSPLTIFLNNSSIQKAANGTLSQQNDAVFKSDSLVVTLFLFLLSILHLLRSTRYCSHRKSLRRERADLFIFITHNCSFFVGLLY